MKKLLIAAIMAGVPLGRRSRSRPKPPATPATPSPLGEWAVENGQAHIRVASYATGLWGVISWTNGPAGTDEHNPDPAKRSRSMLGMPILINMQPGKNQWEGKVYNAEDGETYTSNIGLIAADRCASRAACSAA